METITVSTPTRIEIHSITPKSYRPKLGRCPVSSALKPSGSSNIVKTKDTITTNTIYNDNWLDRFAINDLSKTCQNTVGIKNEEDGYESLVMVAGAIFRSFDPIQQCQLVVEALQNATPGILIFLITHLMRPSKFWMEFSATLTTIFFRWLVGPCEVRESQYESGKEKNVVFIKKCRFLETTSCAGMCTNLCKMPTQEFMKNTLGIPIHMVPNFDDMSCEFIHGQDPPALQDDPAFKQPCFKLCNAKRTHRRSCMS